MRAVIFDFDGVLVDSEPLHFRSLRDGLASEGIAITEQDYVQVYLAYDDREAIRLAFERSGRTPDRALTERVAQAKARAFEAELLAVRFFPGARELVAGLASNVPLAIASGALGAEIDAILRAGGLRGCFDAVVSADDVARTKPDPEPYLEAARRLRARMPDLAPEECLAIEDSPAGLASARAAGLLTIGVTNSYPAAKLQGLAQRIVGSLEELSYAELATWRPD